MNSSRAISDPTPIGTITVPKLSERQLIALAERSFQEAGIPFDKLDELFREWDFLRDECGKTYHVFARPFEESSFEGSMEMREWQKSIRTDGQAALFVAWVIEQKPVGHFTSIPNDDKHIYRLHEEEHCHCGNPNCRRPSCGTCDILFCNTPYVPVFHRYKKRSRASDHCSLGFEHFNSHWTMYGLPISAVSFREI